MPDADRQDGPGDEVPGIGAVIEVIATDPGSVKDMAAWCRTTANELLETSSDGATYRFLIRRK